MIAAPNAKNPTVAHRSTPLVFIFKKGFSETGGSEPLSSLNADLTSIPLIPLLLDNKFASVEIC
jgi:hypothetical protein